MASTVCNLTVDEQKREALGRWLSLVGTTIGVAGTVILLSVNPKVKTTAGALLDHLPGPLRRNKAATVVGIAAVGALIIGAVIVKRMKANKA